MIVGAYLDLAAPDHPAGAEWTIHDTFAWLAARGHDCRILSERAYTQGRINGVLVYGHPSDEDTTRHFQECDVMVTQLRATMRAQILAAAYQTPLVQYVHSATQIEELGVVPGASALVVFNTQHVADACDWWRGESMVLHPAIDAERVRVDGKGQCATLINLSPSKGGMHLWDLATALEGVPFLGVMGAYGDQAITPEGLALNGANESSSGLPRNLRVLAPLRDVREALAYTRTLLVLSHTETYGRVAAEAAVSGIPTIAVDTPGLREAIGPSGIYARRDDPRNLAHLVRRGYTPEAWGEWSKAALLCAEMNRHRQDRELRAFERALRRIHHEQPEMSL